MTAAAKTRLRPLGNRVILRKIESDTRGGIAVPTSYEAAESHTQEYEVVALPPYSDFANTGAQTKPGGVPIDVWTLAEQLGVPNFGEPPRWAVTITQRLKAQQLMGLNGATDGSTAAVGRLYVDARVYLAKHKGFKIETNDGEELYAADVEDILAIEEDVEEEEVQF